ncbi:thiosulfate/3-mercaptopyruvate sulfurtransferase [Rhizobium wenxiniae]|uniref:Thiosulfate/3-mercaptopyruvate sulfurtransferase n=1 Tax=Rhizobium wenxiniae TaxID=1737357 RepID=A0A7X0CXK3_9HYPH|nr:GNAT family N-acetyltransferase [Rhizobium wenxiniae]MBB6160285.1 thiosulfate/3-mercaptopyruvate sulfurtransferase [Rhizobium wenxiniae]
MAKKPSPLKVRVTRLEMTAAPRSSLPVPVNVQTAIMRSPDIPLHFYRYLYRQVGKRWQWYERLRLSDEELAAIIHSKQVSISVLYVDGAPSGFFELAKQPDDVIELSYFGLFERAMGLGIGKWFLLQALYAAWQDNPSKVTVTTNNLDHPRAIQLYQMMGFSPVGTSEETILPMTDTELLKALDG